MNPQGRTDPRLEHFREGPRSRIKFPASKLSGPVVAYGTRRRRLDDEEGASVENVSGLVYNTVTVHEGPNPAERAIFKLWF